MWELIVACLSYAIFEAAYLSATVKGMYDPMFARIQGVRPKYNRMYGAVIAYACIALAWFKFVYRPMSSSSGRISTVIENATLLALAVYGVYNATNLVTFDKWDLRVAVRDVAWGIFALNVISLICFFCMRKRSSS